MNGNVLPDGYRRDHIDHRYQRGIRSTVTVYIRHRQRYRYRRTHVGAAKRVPIERHIVDCAIVRASVVYIHGSQGRYSVGVERQRNCLSDYRRSDAIHNRYGRSAYIGTSSSIGHGERYSIGTNVSTGEGADVRAEGEGTVVGRTVVDVCRYDAGVSTRVELNSNVLANRRGIGYVFDGYHRRCDGAVTRSIGYGEGYLVRTDVRTIEVRDVGIEGERAIVAVVRRSVIDRVFVDADRSGNGIQLNGDVLRGGGGYHSIFHLYEDDTGFAIAVAVLNLYRHLFGHAQISTGIIRSTQNVDGYHRTTVIVGGTEVGGGKFCLPVRIEREGDRLSTAAQRGLIGVYYRYRRSTHIHVASGVGNHEGNRIGSNVHTIEATGVHRTYGNSTVIGRTTVYVTSSNAHRTSASNGNGNILADCLRSGTVGNGYVESADFAVACCIGTR